MVGVSPVPLEGKHPDFYKILAAGLLLLFAQPLNGVFLDGILDVDLFENELFLCFSFHHMEVVAVSVVLDYLKLGGGLQELPLLDEAGFNIVSH